MHHVSCRNQSWELIIIEISSVTNHQVRDDLPTTRPETHTATATQTADVNMYVENKTAGAIQLEQEQAHHHQQGQYCGIPEPIRPVDQHPFHETAAFDDGVVPFPPSSPPANSSASLPPGSPSEAFSHYVIPDAEQVERTPLAESDVNELNEDANIGILDDFAPPPASSQRSSPEHPSSTSKARPYVDIPVLSPFQEAKKVAASQLPGIHTSSPRKPSSSSSVRSRSFRAREESLVIKVPKEVEVVPSSVTPSGPSELEVGPEPRTPARAGPSSTAPLFLPSPTSEPGEEDDVEVGLGSGEFVLDQSLLRDASASVPRVSTRTKGKGKERQVIDVGDSSSEDEIQLLGRSPSKKQVIARSRVRSGVHPKMVERMTYVLVSPAKMTKIATSGEKTERASSSEVSRVMDGTSRQRAWQL